jgi:hypothetical protein
LRDQDAVEWIAVGRVAQFDTIVVLRDERYVTPMNSPV